MRERLQKMLSEAGVASRRKAEALIKEGKVRVNGKVAVIGDTAEWNTDIIEVEGKRVEYSSDRLYFMLHKPRGYITSTWDDRGRKTVMDLMGDIKERVYPVGRLDQASEGLLLFTNDGAVAQRITHPSHKIIKRYYVSVRGDLDSGVQRLAKLSDIDGEKITPPVIDNVQKNDKGGNFYISISEGKNRQIRRMCEAVDLKVVRLKRVSIGRLQLGNLQAGKMRPLTVEEISYLKSI